MTNQPSEFAVDSALRVGQGLVLGHVLVGGILDGIRKHQAQRAMAKVGAVETLARELARTRRLLAGAQAGAMRAEQEAAVLREEVVFASAQAARAEQALARVLQAVHA